MSDDPAIEEGLRHVDYYESVRVFCETCGKDWPTSWDELTDTQRIAAEHWITEHKEASGE